MISMFNCNKTNLILKNKSVNDCTNSIITVQNKNEYHYFWFYERFKEWKEKEREFFNENKVCFVESIDKMVCSF